MNIADWLKQSAKVLKDSGVTTARLDCLILLCDVLHQDKAWLLSHTEIELQGSVLNFLSTRVAQRAKHIPLAYIRGKVDFYGREFVINTHTLVPRPESEAMIELLKRVRNLESNIAVWQTETRTRNSTKKRYSFEKHALANTLVNTPAGYKVVWPKLPHFPVKRAPATGKGGSLNYNDDLCIIDIGTGSGALAITAKLEIPQASVIATDIDEKCLKVARINARHFGAEIQFMQGNLLDPLKHSDTKIFTTIVLLCNLPYVPDDFQVNTAATHEPKHALFGGADGLDLYRELFTQISSAALKPAYILAESLPAQHQTLKLLAEATGYQLQKTDDFIQQFTLI